MKAITSEERVASRGRKARVERAGAHIVRDRVGQDSYVLHVRGRLEGVRRCVHNDALPTPDLTAAHLGHEFDGLMCEQLLLFTGGFCGLIAKRQVPEEGLQRTPLRAQEDCPGGQLLVLDEVGGVSWALALGPGSFIPLQTYAEKEGFEDDLGPSNSAKCHRRRKRA